MWNYSLCLSGFLIGSIFIRNVVQTIAREGQASLGTLVCDFWLRRWFRTLPNYLLFLLVNYLLIDISNAAVSPDILLRFVFFLQGIMHINTPFYGVSWSLAIEEWFYLILPVIFVVVLLLVKRKHAATAFLAAMTFLLLLPMALKLNLMAHLPAYANVEDPFHYRTFLKLDSIFYGLLMAWLWSHERIRQFLIRNKKLLFARRLTDALRQFCLCDYVCTKTGTTYDPGFPVRAFMQRRYLVVFSFYAAALGQGFAPGYLHRYVL